MYNIFLPALIFTNIIRTLSSNPPAAIFLLPLIALAQVLFGFVLSKLSAKPLQLTDAESRVYTVCTTFGNSAALPLLFASALFQGADLANMVSGISFFLIGWTGLFWSIGYSILAGMPNGDETESNSKEQVIPMSTKEKITLLIKRILSPPLTAALCALVIGLIPSLRIPFTKSPLAAALQTLGTGYAPAAVLILAGSLARKQSGDNSASLLRLPRMTAGIIMSRFLILPLTTALVVKRFMPFLKSPFIILAILLEAIMPPAQNSTLILNLENRPDAASAVAKILLAVYLLGVIPISVGLTYFLGMAGV